MRLANGIAAKMRRLAKLGGKGGVNELCKNPSRKKIEKCERDFSEYGLCFFGCGNHATKNCLIPLVFCRGDRGPERGKLNFTCEAIHLFIPLPKSEAPVVVVSRVLEYDLRAYDYI